MAPWRPCQRIKTNPEKNLFGAKVIVQVANPLPHLLKQTDGVQKRVAGFHCCIYSRMKSQTIYKNPNKQAIFKEVSMSPLRRSPPMNKSFLCLVLAAASVAGCASSSGALSLGPDTYRISASRHNMAGGAPSAESDALTQAQAHCKSLGRELLVVNTTVGFDRPHYTFMATFRCLKQGDPALVRPTY